MANGFSFDDSTTAPWAAAMSRFVCSPNLQAIIRMSIVSLKSHIQAIPPLVHHFTSSQYLP